MDSVFSRMVLAHPVKPFKLCCFLEARTQAARAATYLRSAADGILGMRLACIPLAFGSSGLSSSLLLLKSSSSTGVLELCMLQDWFGWPVPWDAAVCPGGTTFLSFLSIPSLTMGLGKVTPGFRLDFRFVVPSALPKVGGLVGNLLTGGGWLWCLRLSPGAVPGGLPTGCLPVVVFPCFFPGFLCSKLSEAGRNREGCNGQVLVLVF